MQIYQVGGSVRDIFLGTPSQDHDWVVIGSSPQEMLDLGYTQVGADFPVFLHPQTNEEYALARTERKSGAGYLGFEVKVQDVTLEEDLMRRDLTINAIARSKDGNVIDPFGGMSDVHFNVLRHVSEAFAEDPVRILRVLRFLARFGPRWTIAPETETLMHKMVRDGEASNLAPERIWKETSRALMEPHPWLYLEGLERFGLTNLPCFEPYRFVSFAVPVSRTASRTHESLNTRCALVFGHSNAAEKCPAGFPSDVWKRVSAWAKYGSNTFLLEPEQNAEATLQFFENVGLFRSPEVLETLLDCWCVTKKSIMRLLQASRRALSVDTKGIAAGMSPGIEVGHAIRRARLASIAQVKPVST